MPEIAPDRRMLEAMPAGRRNEYLEERFPAVPLMPGSPVERARCQMWDDLADHFLAVHVTLLIREVFMKPDPEERDAAAASESLQAFAGYLGRLETRLGECEYLCEVYSLADIATWLSLTFGQTLGVEIGPFRNVQAWHGLVGARPAVAAETR